MRRAILSLRFLAAFWLVSLTLFERPAWSFEEFSRMFEFVAPLAFAMAASHSLPLVVAVACVLRWLRAATLFTSSPFRAANRIAVVLAILFTFLPPVGPRSRMMDEAVYRLAILAGLVGCLDGRLSPTDSD